MKVFVFCSFSNKWEEKALYVPCAIPGRKNVCFTAQLTQNWTSEVSVLCNNFVRSHRIINSKKCYPLCFPWRSEGQHNPVTPRLHPQLSLLLAPNRVFPPCLQPTAWPPGIGPKSRTFGHSSSLPCPRPWAQEPARSGGPAERPVTVPIPAAPVWHRRVWQDPCTAPVTPLALAYILLTPSHINNLYPFFFFCSGPYFPDFIPLFGNFSLAHWPDKPEPPFTCTQVVIDTVGGWELHFTTSVHPQTPPSTKTPAYGFGNAFLNYHVAREWLFGSFEILYSE